MTTLPTGTLAVRQALQRLSDEIMRCRETVYREGFRGVKIHPAACPADSLGSWLFNAEMATLDLIDAMVGEAT